MHLTKRQSQAFIRSKISNWNWETMNTPEWLKELLAIGIMIDDHNTKHHNDNMPPIPFNIKQKLIEIHDLL